MLQGEINLDARFALLSAHLKRLGGRDGDVTSTNAIASATGLPEQWVSDAIEGSMAEIIYRQHGALIIDGMGGVEIPAHLETNSNSTYEEQSVMTPVVCEVRV